MKLTITSLIAFALLPVVSGTAVAQPAISSSATGTECFRVINKSKGNHVSVDPAADFSRYKRYEILSSVYEPSNPRKPLKSRDAQKVTALFGKSLK